VAESWIPYAIGGALLAIPLVAMAKPSGSGEVEDGVPVPVGKRRKRFRCAFGATHLSDDWMRFFEQTARRESNFRPNALNSTPSEVSASDRMNDNSGVIDGINFSSYKWEFGSRGLFQFLGVVIALRGGKLRFSKSITNPKMGYNPGISMAAAVDYARGLMTWNNFEGSWASLNAGWGWPAKMGNADRITNSARKMENRAAELGWARGWARQPVPTIPSQTRSELDALANVARLHYNAC